MNLESGVNAIGCDVSGDAGRRMAAYRHRLDSARNHLEGRLQSLERDFFRTLNRFVEPAVRAGLFSPRYAPASLILLETVGFKTGTIRHTPLLATRLGRYQLVSTFRGGRSFWVRNLQREPNIRYHQGGKVRKATAYVLLPGQRRENPKAPPPAVGRIMDLLSPLTALGWAFAILRTELTDTRADPPVLIG
jgi:deazaflavin-dependent oxidoreductase (nitroreductase family)